MSIKTVMGGDIHRMQLSDITFDALSDALVATYGPGSYTVRYEDEDKDMISVSSTVELEEAFRVSNNATLKLFITSKDSPNDDKPVPREPVITTKIVETPSVITTTMVDT